MQAAIRRRLYTILWLLVVSGNALAADAAESADGGWAASTHGASSQLRYRGSAELLGQRREFTLVFTSDSTDSAEVHGVVGFDLQVFDIGGLAAFPFDDFEGPDAPSYEDQLMQLELLGGEQSPRQWRVSPSGWIPDSGNFAFGLSALNRQVDSVPRQLFAAIAAGASSLRLTISAPHDATLSLRFEVPVAQQQAGFRALLERLAGVPLQP